MSKVITPPIAQFADNDFNPLSSGTVSFYYPGTTTLKDVYTDYQKTTPAQNPQPLNAGGWFDNGTGTAPLWYGVGYYDFVVKDSDGAVIYSAPNILGDGEEVVGALGFTTVSNISDLMNIDSSLFKLVYAAGYHLKSDNGGGFFYFDSSISPSGGWVRIINGEAVRPEMFGAVTGDSSINATSIISEMIDWCKLNFKKIEFTPGIYYLNGDITFDGNLSVTFPEGVQFLNVTSGESNVIITCSDAIIESSETPLVQPYNGTSPTTNLSYNPVSNRDSYAEWWGVDGINSVSSDNQILAAIAGSNDRLVFSLGDKYETSTNTDFSSRNIIFENESKLTITGGATFDKFEINQSSPAIAGDFNITFVERSEYNAEWFDFGETVDATKFNSLATSLTGSIKKAVLNWNRGNYTFTSVSITDYQYLQHSISGSRLTFTTDTSFGEILSSKAGIVPTGTGNPILCNNAIYLDWFGGVPYLNNATQSQANRIAITYALDTVGLSGQSSYLTGTGLYYIDSGIIYAQDTTIEDNGYFVKIKNLDLTTYTSFNPATVNSVEIMFGVDGNLEVKNCRFIVDEQDCCALYCDNELTVKDCFFNTVSASATVYYSIYQDTHVQGARDIAGRLSLNGNSFENSNGVYFKSENAIIADNKFKSMVQPLINESGLNAQILGNYFDEASVFGSVLSFEGAVICSGNHFNENPIWFLLSPQNMVFSGNSFTGTHLRLSNPSNIVIKDNTFTGDSFVEFYTFNTSQTVDNTIIESNVFSGTTGDIVEFAGSGTWADFGHSAIVRNNNVSGMTEVYTEKWYSHTIDVENDLNAGQSGVISQDAGTDLILRSAEEPFIESFQTNIPYISGGTQATDISNSGIEFLQYGGIIAWPTDLKIKYHWSGAQTDVSTNYYFQDIKYKINAGPK